MAELQDPIIPLVEGRLYLLPNPYRLDGRVSTHPPEARGVASQNCYLFVEGGHAVLADTGFSVHERSLIERLETLIRPDMTFELCILRLGEYYGICNVRPIVERFGVKTIYSTRPDGVACCDFRPEYTQYGAAVSTGTPSEVNGVMLRGSGEIDMGNGRVLRLTRAPLRLLPTNWVHDAATGTLLTADVFSYMWHEHEGAWIVGAEEPLPGERHVRDFMVGTRYW